MPFKGGWLHLISSLMVNAELKFNDVVYEFPMAAIRNITTNLVSLKQHKFILLQF